MTKKWSQKVFGDYRAQSPIAKTQQDCFSWFWMETLSRREVPSRLQESQVVVCVRTWQPLRNCVNSSIVTWVPPEAKKLYCPETKGVESANAFASPRIKLPKIPEDLVYRAHGKCKQTMVNCSLWMHGKSSSTVSNIFNSAKRKACVIVVASAQNFVQKVEMHAVV